MAGKKRVLNCFSIAQKIDLNNIKHRAKKQLPTSWLKKIDTLAGAAARAGDYWRRVPAQIEVWRDWLNQYGGAQFADMTDAQIKERASECAREAKDLELGELMGGGMAWQAYERLMIFCDARGVVAPPVALLLVGMAARVQCPYWWRRALRKMIARKCEKGAMALGLVNKPAGQSYTSDRAVWRRIDQNKRNAAALANTWLENEDGQRANLEDLAKRSTANKAIRRGELMTRIRGCEEVADSKNHVGLFLTGTCPSRFHSVLFNGQPNPKHDGSTPKDAQNWLCKQWARLRAALARRGVHLYGFRVSEPHHDGCTHWHMLVWCAKQTHAWAVGVLMRRYWLADAGEEPGADKYRVNIKRMVSGVAAGYISKYIAKNIDDANISEHLDDYGDVSIGVDLLGDMEVKPCMRVEAWASTWGIRQFQAIGQPPVTVWRELRRINEVDAKNQGYKGVIHSAWTAAQKWAGLASWAGYVDAQGGMMRGRNARIKLATDTREMKGLYGACVRSVPVGVRLNVNGARCVWSQRKYWKSIDAPVSASVSVPAFTRTRVNNCTRHNQIRRGVLVEMQIDRAIETHQGRVQAAFMAAHHGRGGRPGREKEKIVVDF